MPVEDAFDLDIRVNTKDLAELDKYAARAAAKFAKNEREFEKTKRLASRVTAKQGKIQERIDKISGKVEERQTRTLDQIERKHAQIQSKLDQITGRVETKQDRQLEADAKKFFRERKAAFRISEQADAKEKKERERFARLAKAIQRRHTDDRTFLQKVLGGGISSNPRVALKLFQNPLGFVQSAIALVPLLGAVLGAKEIAEFIWKELVRIDGFYKQFVDGAEDRINALRDREQEALIRTGYKQVIFTTQAGTVEPRESYNSYEEFNTAREMLENRFATRNNSGVP